MLNKGSFIKFMHIAASTRETRGAVPYANHFTAQLNENENNSQVSYRHQISNLQIQHMLTSQSYSCVAKRNTTEMVITTLKTILNEKVGYRLCQVILLFWLQQKVFLYAKYKIYCRRN